MDNSKICYESIIWELQAIVEEYLESTECNISRVLGIVSWALGRLIGRASRKTYKKDQATFKKILQKCLKIIAEGAQEEYERKFNKALTND